MSEENKGNGERAKTPAGRKEHYDRMIKEGHMAYVARAFSGHNPYASDAGAERTALQPEMDRVAKVYGVDADKLWPRRGPQPQYSPSVTAARVQFARIAVAKYGTTRRALTKIAGDAPPLSAEHEALDARRHDTVGAAVSVPKVPGFKVPPVINDAPIAEAAAESGAEVTKKPKAAKPAKSATATKPKSKKAK